MDQDWAAYQEAFIRLLDQRQVLGLWESSVFDPGINCLLCAEHEPQNCHRRLAAEHFQKAHPEIEIRHLV